MKHTQEEEQKLFAITVKWVYNCNYKPVENDILFIEKYYRRLVTPELEEWLKQL